MDLNDVLNEKFLGKRIKFLDDLRKFPSPILVRSVNLETESGYYGSQDIRLELGLDVKELRYSNITEDFRRGVEQCQDIYYHMISIDDNFELIGVEGENEE